MWREGEEESVSYVELTNVKGYKLSSAACELQYTVLHALLNY